MLAADTYTVTTLADVVDANDGLISFREALTLAATDDATDDGDVIDFATGLFTGGSEELVLGDTTGDKVQDSTPTELLVDSDVHIVGPGEGLLSIDAQSGSRLFQIASGSSATIEGLSLTGGHTDGHGGAIFNAGDLTLDTVDVSGNSSDLYGGAIRSIGTLEIIDSTFDGNTATYGGGSISLASSGPDALLITRSTFSNNSANTDGAIRLAAGRH